MSLETNFFHKTHDRKYILVEGKDGTAEAIFINEPAKLQGGETERDKKIREARQKIYRKVSKPARPFTWRLGYNHCIGQWTGSEKYPTLSGSSLNRKKKVVPKKDKKEKPEGVVHIFSGRSRGKVKDKSMAFFRSISNNRTFLTLTFIQDLPDKEGVHILNKFLTVLRKEKPGLQYLWVAEHQEETRSTIHFHIILNRRLPIKRYNALWVLQQYNAGLIGHRENGEEISKTEMERRYHYDINSKFQKKDPDSVMAVLNPFHIEKAYGINKLAHYLTKYITDQKKEDPFGCLNWHCSRRVSKLFTKEIVSPSTFAYLLSFVNYQVDRKTGECFIPKVLTKQYFTMVYINNKGAPLNRLKQLETVNKWLIKKQVRDPDREQLAVLDDDLYRKIICVN